MNKASENIKHTNMLVMENPKGEKIFKEIMGSFPKFDGKLYCTRLLRGSTEPK